MRARFFDARRFFVGEPRHIVLQVLPRFGAARRPEAVLRCVVNGVARDLAQDQQAEVEATYALWRPELSASHPRLQYTFKSAQQRERKGYLAEVSVPRVSPESSGFACTQRLVIFHPRCLQPSRVLQVQ
jgi:hypothetical protein